MLVRMLSKENDACFHRQISHTATDNNWIATI